MRRRGDFDLARRERQFRSRSHQTKGPAVGCEVDGEFASRSMRVSEIVGDSSTPALVDCRSKVVRRIAVEPPQQKFFDVSPPSAEAIDAFHTPRSREASPARTGTNHRYPLDAPSPSSTSGATSFLSHWGFRSRVSINKHQYQTFGSMLVTATRRLWTFCPLSVAGPAMTIFAEHELSSSVLRQSRVPDRHHDRKRRQLRKRGNPA